MIRIHIATHNPHKAATAQALFDPKYFQTTYSGHLHLIEPEENGHSFYENALIKAKSAAQQLNHPTWIVGDDSGLIVPAINNQPGIYSARWAGQPYCNQRNCEKLINTIQEHNLNFPVSAHYHTTLTLLHTDQIDTIHTFTANMHGHIIQHPRYHNGHHTAFGYDGHFLMDGLGYTAAEAPELKHQHSHRRLAFDQLITFLLSTNNITAPAY